MTEPITITLNDGAVRGALQQWVASQLSLVSTDQVTVGKVTKARDGSLAVTMDVDLTPGTLDS